MIISYYLLENDYLGNQESALKIIGGTVARAEVPMLKKLLFRGTRGKALLNTFFLDIDESDMMNKVDFEFDKMIGYIIIYQETLHVGDIIQRICKSFQAGVYQTSITTCERDLK